MKKDNWFNKLTEAETAIWTLIYYHPTFISNRTQALNLLFCTIGTGIEWVDGELKDTIDDNYLNRRENSINSFEHDFCEKAYTNTFSKRPIMLDHLRRKDVERMRAYAFYENTCAQYVWDNIEKLVTTLGPPKYFYPVCNYSNLMSIPKKTKPGWRALAIETCELILLCDPNYKTDFGPHGLGNKGNIKLAKKQLTKLRKWPKEST